MTPEHYRVRIEGDRVLIAIVGEETLGRIQARLHEVGARAVGPSAWLCDEGLSVERLSEAVGELDRNEVVYLAANGAERIDFGFLAAPNSEGGIIVTT
jgi:hypothetical protein